MGQGIAPTYTVNVVHLLYRYIAPVDTTFNVFSYDADWTEHRTHYIPDAEQMSYMLCDGRGSIDTMYTRHTNRMNKDDNIHK